MKTPTPVIHSDEGWQIIASDTPPTHYQLQRDDELAVFKDDAAAWEYVWEQAHMIYNSPIHADALAFLKTYSPTEYRLISNHCTLKDTMNQYKLTHKQEQTRIERLNYLIAATCGIALGVLCGLFI